MINILIVDDHQVVGEGTKGILSSEPDFNVDLMICSKQVNDVILQKKYDVYVIDLNMPEKNGMELAAEILSMDRNAKVLIFTGHDISTYFNYLIDIGVSGFISKYYSRQQLICAVKCAVEGLAIIPTKLLSELRRTENEVEMNNGRKISLTNKEEEILVQVSKGLTNDEIAEVVYMSKRNVERHLTQIFKKLVVSSRAEAIAKGKELGLIPEVIL